MAVTSFTVNTSTSDFQLGSNGISIKGTFTSSGSFTASHYKVVLVAQNGTEIPLNGGSIQFNSTTGTFEYNVNNGQSKDIPQAPYTIKFVNTNGTSGTGDDTIVTQTSTPINISCFYPGTMIATPAGEVAVETLKIGDMVLRQDGTASEIRWMGRNTVALYFADHLKALPIRIKKDALAANVPSRDLLVSPDHAMLVDGILAQAGALVNGTSIVRETNVPGKFTYHHIELAEHAVVMAENAPAETFIDNVDRMSYDNWAEHEALYGELPSLVEMDLPRAKSRRQVPMSIRQRLDERAVELGYTAAAKAA